MISEEIHNFSAKFLFLKLLQKESQCFLTAFDLQYTLFHKIIQYTYCIQLLYHTTLRQER